MYENLGGSLTTTLAGGIAGTGITAFAQRAKSLAAPPPPPETFGAYTKKHEETNGVIEMMDLLVKDLDKEMQVATVEEKDAQGDYEEMMAASAEKRAADSKSITEKGEIKASLQEELLTSQEAKKDATSELAATLEIKASLQEELLTGEEAKKDA